MPTFVASTGCQRQLVDINIIADQKFRVPPRLRQVRGDGMPSGFPGKMLHLQRTGSSKAGKKQTLFAVSVFTNYLKWILADKNMAVSRNF